MPLLRLSWETDTWTSGEIDHAETISLLYLIVEQSLEWNSSHVSFVDFEKAFDSVDHAILWKILCYPSVSEKFISLSVKALYSDSKIRMVPDGELWDPFLIKHGGRQDCLLSPLFFLLVVNCVSRTTKGSGRNYWSPVDSHISTARPRLCWRDSFSFILTNLQKQRSKH